LAKGRIADRRCMSESELQRGEEGGRLAAMIDSKRHCPDLHFTQPY